MIPTHFGTVVRLGLDIITGEISTIVRCYLQKKDGCASRSPSRYRASSSACVYGTRCTRPRRIRSLRNGWRISSCFSDCQPTRTSRACGGRAPRVGTHIGRVRLLMQQLAFCGEEVLLSSPLRVDERPAALAKRQVGSNASSAYRAHRLLGRQARPSIRVTPCGNDAAEGRVTW